MSNIGEKEALHSYCGNKIKCINEHENRKKNVLYRLITGNYTKYNFSSLLCLGIISVIGIIGLMSYNLSSILIGEVILRCVGTIFVVMMLPILALYASVRVIEHDFYSQIYCGNLAYGLKHLNVFIFSCFAFAFIIYCIHPLVSSVHPLMLITYTGLEACKVLFSVLYMGIIVILTAIKVRLYDADIENEEHFIIELCYANKGKDEEHFKEKFSPDRYEEIRKSCDGDIYTKKFLKLLIGQELYDKYVTVK